MYRLMRDQDRGNPNPVVVTPVRGAIQISNQIKDYLLCGECETRLKRRGEDFAMKHCYRGRDTFRMRSLLRESKPAVRDSKIEIYRGSTIPNFEELVYFAISVFWRAAVHTWRFEGRRYHIDVGPYSGGMRRYLLDEAPFPAHMALSIRISSRDDLLACTPQSGTMDGYHVHKFLMPGMMFLLLVGGRIPEYAFRCSTAPSPERFISIHPKSEINDLAAMAQMVQSTDLSIG